MRVARVLMVGALIAGGVALLAPGAGGSVPALSKQCKSLQALDTKLEAALASTTSNYDSGSISNLSKSFKKAAKTAPKAIKSAMNAIASVASDVASQGNATAAAATLKKDAAKVGPAVVTWGSYLSHNCAATTTPSS